MMLGEQTLVLNKSWCVINVTTAKKAMGLMYGDVARAVCPNTYEVHDFFSWITMVPRDKDPCISTVSLKIKIPEIIQLTGYDRIPPQGATFSRKNIYTRDNYSCQYCAKSLKTHELSVDHVVPKSKGGGSSWTNCVTACKSCNKKKGNKSLKLSGMKLLKEPKKPRWDFELYFAVPTVKQSWKRFIKTHSG